MISNPQPTGNRAAASAHAKAAPGIAPRGDVAILLPSLVAGGATRVAVAVANELAKRGDRVDLVVMTNHGEFESKVSSQVHLVRLGCSRVRWSPPAIARYLKTQRPQRLLAMTTTANLAGIVAAKLARSAARIVLVEQNTLSAKAAAARLPLRRMATTLARWCYPAADRIVAVSNGVADDLSRVMGIERDRIDVIYNPVCVSDIGALSQQSVDDDWYTNSATPLILSVGRLVAQKDFPTLLRAFRKLLTRRSARLLILGEGVERRALERIVHDLDLTDAVRLPGFDDNPFRFMSKARMFVLSSAWEGFALVILEAMVCGCPVVSTDCESGPREILLDGKLGQLVPVGDADAMAAAMERELDRSPDVDAIQRRIADFSLRQCVDQYEAALSSNESDPSPTPPMHPAATAAELTAGSS